MPPPASRSARSHQSTRCSCGREYRTPPGRRRRRGVGGYTPGDDRLDARPDRALDRPAHRLLVRGHVRPRPRGDLRRRGARGAPAGPRHRPPRQRHHHRRRGGADRRPPLPRHRPVGPLQGRPAGDRPAAVQRPRRLRRDRHRLRGGDPLRPLEAPAVPGLGRRGGARPPRRCRPSARWGNFFNQELYGPPTDLPWGIAIDVRQPDGDVGLPAARHDAGRRPLPPALPLRVALRARSARSSSSSSPAGSARCGPGDLVLLFFAWYGTTRFLLEPLRTNNWTFVGDRRSPRSSAGPSSSGRWRSSPGATGPGRPTGPPTAAAATAAGAGRGARRPPDAAADATPPG